MPKVKKTDKGILIQDDENGLRYLLERDENGEVTVRRRKKRGRKPKQQTPEPETEKKRSWVDMLFGSEEEEEEDNEDEYEED